MSRHGCGRFHSATSRSPATSRAVGLVVDSSPQLPDETMNGLDVPHVADLARALNEAGWTCFEGAHEPGNYDSCADCRRVCNEQVAALTPILSRALAEAWAQGQSAKPYLANIEVGGQQVVMRSTPSNPYLTEKEQSNDD